jgi:hypothetical protein
MPSNSYSEWKSSQAKSLDEIASGHAAVSGTRRGRRFNTQPFNQAYAVLLAAQFQRFCRDLHTECVDHMASTIRSPAAVLPLVRHEFTWNRKLDHGNANPGNLAADFQRLGIDLLNGVKTYNAKNETRLKLIEELNHWRNAIAHQDFKKFGGAMVLRLEQVRPWRGACEHLARAFDEVLRRHLETVIGASPW